VSPRRRTQVVRAVIGRRGDFRETSRVVSLWTRERGLVQALAKGAHRKDSQFLGRLDGFNVVDATLGTSEGMPLLHAVQLVHEPRGLRQPTRFLAAAWIAELLGSAFASERPDPDLFDLLSGGLTLVERAPPASLATVLLGLELRFLELGGSLPSLDGCSTCGRPGDDAPMFVAREGGGVQCGAHRPPASRAVPADTLQWLRALQGTQGRHWPRIPAPRHLRDPVAVLGLWLPAVLDRPPRLRRSALTAAAAAVAAARGGEAEREIARSAVSDPGAEAPRSLQ